MNGKLSSKALHKIRHVITAIIDNANVFHWLHHDECWTFGEAQVLITVRLCTVRSGVTGYFILAALMMQVNNAAVFRCSK